MELSPHTPFGLLRTAPRPFNTHTAKTANDGAVAAQSIMLRFIFLVLLSVVPALFAGPTNSILFVTQVPIPADFVTIGAVFGNHRATPDRCGRGGDLYIRYPDATIRNLTRDAGFGVWGAQATNGISVRQPSVHWSGNKAVFSMVVGTPRFKFDYAMTNYWQLYEITNFLNPGSVPVITKVPNQPANYNNISPIYGTDDRIIFTSDRPRDGQRHLYPQLDEYEEAPTVTGLWNLDPATGDLFLVNHAPSGSFTPLLDSAGRVIFSRWDHLQRDQQADTDVEDHTTVYGAFNWSDESATSVATTNSTEVFPEPRGGRTDLLAGTGLRGHVFNQFFPWQINEDGTEEETLNHVGRHELGGSYANAAFTNDVNIQDLYYFGNHYNTNTIDNFLMACEDPRTNGLFYGIDAPEFGTHSGGQLVSLTGGTNVNPSQMLIRYLTPRATHVYANSAATIPTNHTGFYRNPLMTTDGYMIAAHTTNALYETGAETNTFPATKYEFQLKFLQFTNGFYIPSTPFTSGLTNRASYWDPDVFVTQTNFLWELDPVEVVARARPARLQPHMAAPELAAFAQAGVDVSAFQKYLRTHELALIISRDVTTRDKADRIQPFNLRAPGTNHQTVGAGGKIYDVAWLQLFQADQLRGLNFGNPANKGNGRRIIAQHLHEPAVDNPTTPSAPLASVPIGSDGSMAAIVPARRALSWQLTDTNSVGVVRERYWITFQPGEIRTCASCHGVNTADQANHPAPTNTPSALISLLNYWKTNVVTRPAVVSSQSTNYYEISFTRRPAEKGVTYHVQVSADLSGWSDIASYAGTNIILTAQASERSRVGSPNEVVTVRDTAGMASQTKRFLRILVTRP
ncbi:MAG: hypothetical protein JWM68_1226 [Verrucomicrobiales bacterium]|nr:hypothetical protein [Verrucomicrobiales bacterium]